jgi:diguanylate cyclase (GGDEF)-like protein/PAS domain S-box-containing protein
MIKKLRKRMFLGLHWQGFFWISLLLIALSAVFYALNYRHLMSQFHAQRREEVAALHRQIDGLLTRSADRLVRLSGALASMGDLGEVLQSQDRKRVAGLFSGARYSGLGYELDVQRIELYTQDAKFLWRWTQADPPPPSDAWAQEFIKRVREEDRPLTVLACQPACLLHAFVPILAQGQNVGVIAVSQWVADFIVEFHTVTQTDIALIMPLEANLGAELPRWNARITALTHSSKLTPLLQEISQRFVHPRELSLGHLISWQEDTYDVHAIPLGIMIPAQDGYLILLANVSERLALIQETIRQGFYVTLAALAGAELLLAYLAGVPLRRLEHFAQTLPLLAQGHYAQARQRFSQGWESARLRDEIDALCSDAVALSDRLEQNTDELARKNYELAVERDFTQGLLASAQVLVITQTREGIICSVNAFAARMVGRTPEDLLGDQFTRLFVQPEARPEVLQRLEALCCHRQQSWEHEHRLSRQGGGRRLHIAWVHTPLGEAHSDGTAVLSVGMDISARVEADSKMRWLANHDPLTGLVNRARFNEELERAINEALRAQASAAVFQLDVDFFKEVNDSSGHAAGDEVLRIIAKEIRGRARKTDIVARLGGDEFAILMLGTDRYGAETFAQELNDKIRNHAFAYGDKHYRLGVSIGIALLPEHGADAQKLLAHADMAMYQAKRAGRSRYWVFAYEQEQEAALFQAIYWKDALAAALAENRLFFHFQPVIAIATEQILFHEALLRLRLPDGRIVLPGEFLPHAQRSGLSRDLDAYVARCALAILAATQTINCLSINLSGAALHDAAWAEPLIEAARGKRLAPERLLFEIAETNAIEDLEKAQRIASSLAGLGFRFAIDDFGAGFGSVHYLKQLPISFVKIDSSLIQNLTADAEERGFVQAFISMLHAYGKTAIAEGVEDAATLALLQEMGMDLAQGYYFGQPTPCRSGP